jgi:hypothetical protein
MDPTEKYQRIINGHHTLATMADNALCQVFGRVCKQTVINLHVLLL